jgi:DNA repair protein RadD
MIKLRPYQELSISKTRDAFKQGRKKVLLCVPTGGGKTTIASQIIKNAVDNGKKVIFLAHRQELIHQAHARLLKFGVTAGMIMGKYKYAFDSVNVASIQSLQRRYMPPADLIFIDEAHHTQSAGIKKILDNYPNAYVIGLTATPERLDKKPLSDFYEELLETISINELIQEGFLVDTRVFAAADSIKTEDLANVKSAMGDYAQNELYKLYNKSKLYKGVVDNYKKIAPNTKAIVFNINCEHSKNTCQEFINNGIQAKHLDADTPEDDRKQILKDFANGLFDVLCNVNILTEGYDLPSIETVILNRATQSASLYFQMVGRGLRTAPNKDYCTVIDHGDNWKTHGLVTDEREWNWQGKKKKKQGAFPVKECPKCGQIMSLQSKICVSCNYIFPQKEQEPQEELVSEFVEITKQLPKHLQNKSTTEMSIEELEMYREFKGYKIGWLMWKIAERHKDIEEEDKKKNIKQDLQHYAKLKQYKPSWVEFSLNRIS